MARYLRLYLHFVRFSLSRAMQFRMDFFFRIVMDTAYYAVNIYFYRLIFLHTSSLGGWSEPQAMVFVAGYLLVDALNMTIFSNNYWIFPQLINRGDMDYYLLRPVSSLFFVSCRDFAANSFINLLMACGILAWAISTYPGHIGTGAILLFAVLIVNGTFLFYMTHMLCLIPVFWLHSARGLEYLHWTTSKFAERPDRIFSGWLRRALVSILPLAIVASFPARLVIEGFNWRVLVHILVVTAFEFAVMLWVWRAGLRSYSSASS